MSRVVNNAASCAAPSLQTSEGSVRAGSSVTVTGRWFVRECHDTGQRASPNPPIAAVTLVLRARDGREFILTTAHPVDGGSFTAEVTVPQATALGPATITSRDSHGNERLGTDADITITP